MKFMKKSCNDYREELMGIFLQLNQFVHPNKEPFSTMATNTN